MSDERFCSSDAQQASTARARLRDGERGTTEKRVAVTAQPNAVPFQLIVFGKKKVFSS